MKLGPIDDLPIKHRVARQDSKSTIVNCLDAIVELVTNSDDSYRRLEDAGIKKSGVINIFLSRAKGGICTELRVRDLAEGISREKMKTVYPYGERSSGIEKHNVRGFFGRGLKQVIIAFGEGEIHSIKDNIYSGIKIWWDQEEEKTFFSPIESLTEEEMRELGLGQAPNETLIIVKNKFNDPDYSIPTYKNLKKQIQNHFALRNILSSDNRIVNLKVQDWKITESEKNIRFVFPAKYKKIYDDSVLMETYKDKLRIEIFESAEPFRYEKPTGLSGLILRSKDANLDLRFFSYENDDAAFYFFGTVYCDGLYEQIKNDSKHLIEPNRSGLNWRHPYCIEIKNICEKVIAQFIEKKRNELNRDVMPHISRNKKEILSKLRHLLNDIARDELENTDQNKEPGNYDHFQIIPDYAYIEPGQWRSFSIYCPKYIIEETGTNKVLIESNNYLVYTSDKNVELIPHPKYKDEEILFSSFQVSGDKYGEIAKVTCKLKNIETSATIIFKEQGVKGKRTHKNKNKEGFIKDIVPDLKQNPSQRARFEDGIIYIHINFPGTREYINNDLHGLTNPEGQLLLAEIVAETFFRSIVSQKFEENLILKIPGQEIDQYNRAIYELQKKHLKSIQEGIMSFIKP